MSRFFCVWSLLLICVLWNSAAHAQDECKDVLINKVMDSVSITKDNYYNTALFSNLNETKDDQTEHSASGGLEIEGIPGSLSYNDASRLKTSLSKTFSFKEIVTEKSSYLLMSGQKEIVGAWRDCMSERGGLGVRFEPQDKDGLQTLLEIEYIRPSNPTLTALDLQLANDVYMGTGGTRVLANEECLRKDKIYKAGDVCTVLLGEDTAWTTLPIVLFAKTKLPGGQPGNSVTYKAYLAPRAELVGSTRPWPSEGAASTKRTYAGRWKVTSEVECFDASDGFVFLENSINVQARPEGSATVNSCGSSIGNRPFALDTTGRRICVQQFNGAPNTGDHYCSLGITATEATVQWQPPAPTTH